MENLIKKIKEAIAAELHTLDPEKDVFFEEIKRTDEEHGLTMGDTWYFVSLIPVGNTTVDRYYTDMSFLVDIAYHEKSESNIQYLMKAAGLDHLFRPVFSFEDRKVTIPEASETITDHTLHYSFSLRFRSSEETEPEFGPMGELQAGFTQEEHT